MPRSKTASAQPEAGRPRTAPLEYAGKWVAWSAGGRRIVAVAETFAACKRAAVAAGLPVDQVAIDMVPRGRRRLTGSWV